MYQSPWGYKCHRDVCIVAFRNFLTKNYFLRVIKTTKINLHPHHQSKPAKYRKVGVFLRFRSNTVITRSKQFIFRCITKPQRHKQLTMSGISDTSICVIEWLRDVVSDWQVGPVLSNIWLEYKYLWPQECLAFEHVQSNVRERAFVRSIFLWMSYYENWE